MRQLAPITTEMPHGLMRDGLLIQPNQRPWTGYGVPGHSPHLSPDDKGNKALLPSHDWLCDACGRGDFLFSAHQHSVAHRPKLTKEEIVEDLQAALEQFRLIAGDLAAAESA